jgi:hypothetical protein
MVGAEFSQILVDIENDGYGDNKEDGINIGADKLFDNISVQS